MEKNLNDIVNYLVDERVSSLSNKPHCKKYLDIRKKVDNIINDMLIYYDKSDYNFDKEFEKISKIIYSECTYISEDIKLNWRDDKDILLDMLLFKNCPNVKCIAEEFLAKKLYKNEEEKKIIQCILKSHLSIYKIVKYHDNGFVEIEDLITKKRIRIVDIASSLGFNKDIYMINRIISYNGISFGTGFDLTTYGNNKEIDRYLKNNISNKSKISIIIELRSIIKSQSKNANKNFIYHYYN